MDKIIFNGNLGADPKEQTTQDGRVLVRLNVAVTHRVKGEKQTEWRNVTCSGKTAEFAMNFLKKGRAVLIEGRPSPRAYKNKLEETVGVIDVWADAVEAIGGGKDSAEQGSPTGNAPAGEPGPVDVSEEGLPF